MFQVFFGKGKNYTLIKDENAKELTNHYVMLRPSIQYMRAEFNPNYILKNPYPCENLGKVYKIKEINAKEFEEKTTHLDDFYFSVNRLEFYEDKKEMLQKIEEFKKIV